MGSPPGRVDCEGDGSGAAVLFFFSFVSIHVFRGVIPGLCAQRTAEAEDLFSFEREGAVRPLDFSMSWSFM